MRRRTVHVAQDMSHGACGSVNITFPWIVSCKLDRPDRVKSLIGMSRKDNVVQTPDEGLYDDDRHVELIVSGAIFPEQAGDNAVDVKRGMLILTKEGQEAGRVAAVIVDRQDQHVTHILLSRLGELLEYRIVPIALVAQVDEEEVRLCIFNQVVDTLPIWQGS